MTESELKARELVIKFQFQKPPLKFDEAKKYAKIAVRELISEVYDYGDNPNRVSFLKRVEIDIEEL